MQNINTSKMKPAKLSEKELIKEQKEVEKKFVEDSTVEVTIPKALSGKLTNPYYWSLNGVVFAFELGKPKKVPKPVADHINKMLNEIQ